MAAFRACMTSDRPRTLLESDLRDAEAVGVRGLPTYYIGRERFVGAKPEVVVRASIERALAAAPGS